MGIVTGIFARSAALRILLLSFIFLPIGDALAASSQPVNATITITVCGNGIKESGEQCDNADLAGASCVSRGFAGGTLSCTPSCDYSTTMCTASAVTPPTTGSSGGGGGGGSSSNGPTLAQVVFKGTAYPGSFVTITKDGAAIVTVPAGPDANFEITASDLNVGAYVFGISTVDGNGVKSILQTFPISVSSATITVVSGIFIPPTISLDKTQVKQGDILTMIGQTLPDAKVTISVHSAVAIVNNVIADKKGAWLYKLDTTSLEYGAHTTQARATTISDISAASAVLNFTVGSTSVSADSVTNFDTVDLTGDRKVDLIDF
jgi:hypothetical protein